MKNNQKTNLKKETNKLFLDTYIHIIWFSVAENEFLPHENIIRLIDFRMRHPEFSITFIYSSELLTTKAQSELVDFCSLYNIERKDISYEYLGNFLNKGYNDEYLKLIKDTYKSLIENPIPQLTVALSDLLRVISSQLFGMYIDFDLLQNSSFEPNKIEVYSPLVVDYRDRQDKINNCFFGVPKDKNGEITVITKEKLNQLQDIILKSYKSFYDLIYITGITKKELNENLFTKLKKNHIERNIKSLTTIEEITTIIALNYYSNSLRKFSLLDFVIYLYKNLDKEMIKGVFQIIFEQDNEDINQYIEGIIEKDFDMYKNEILKKWVMGFAGSNRYSDFINEQENKQLYDKSYNDLIDSIKSLPDKVDGIYLFGDESWMVTKTSKSIIQSEEGRMIFNRLLDKKYPDFSFLDKDTIDYNRYIYLQTIKNLYYQNINNNSQINIDLWYTGDRIHNLLNLQLQGDQFYIAPQTQNGHEVTIDNVAQAISYAMNGRISLLPILMNNNHWVSLVIRRASDDQPFDVIFIDSLGNSFNYYNTQVIRQVLDNLTHSNFRLTDASTYGIHQQFNSDDCGVWTVANLVSIGTYLSSAKEVNFQELFFDYLDIGNASNLRAYYNDLENNNLYNNTNESNSMVYYNHLENNNLYSNTNESNSMVYYNDLENNNFNLDYQYTSIFKDES